MPSIFETLEQRVMGFIKTKLKLGSLDVGNVQDICKFQREYLNNFVECLGVFSDTEINQLRDLYLAENRKGIDKFDTYPIILDMKQELHGKAGLYERARCFGAALQASKTLIKVSDEISKNVKMLVGANSSITIEGAKITDVLMMGILREIDIFVNYTGYLWEYFTNVINHKGPQVPYRAMYLADNEEAYFAILENVCDKANTYSFLREVDTIKRKNADLVLYNNKSSFLPFLNRRNYSADDELHIQHGIVGLNIFAWIASKWENWKYAQYKKAQKHRDWLKQEEFMLKQKLNGVDPSSPEYKKTEKYVEAYSAEITKLDQEIAQYEGSTVEDI